PEEVKSLLGEEEGAIFCQVYDERRGGNFEGKSILNLPQPVEDAVAALQLPLQHLTDLLARGRAKLFAHRESRIKPARDEKILTAWNGLMLAALAEAARVLDRPDYGEVAIQNAEFILSTMMKEGRLFRTWKAEPGQAKLMGYLEDY